MKILSLFLILFFSACGSAEDDKNPKKVDPSLNLSPTSGFILDFEEIMVFDQGREKTFDITATVPAPGNAVLAAEALPEGAVLENAQLKYKPSCTLDFEKGQFYRHYLRLPFRITLRSDKDPESFLQKSGIILVFKHNKLEEPCE
jgi:hypothetical protein